MRLGDAKEGNGQGIQLGEIGIRARDRGEAKEIRKEEISFFSLHFSPPPLVFKCAPLTRCTR